MDVAWGEIHRVRRGSVDVPVGGCSGALGCFRVLDFARDPTDGKLVANSADGWVLAVEFDDIPRAYSVLAYGESPNPELSLARRSGRDVRARRNEEGRVHRAGRGRGRGPSVSARRAAVTRARGTRRSRD